MKNTLTISIGIFLLFFIFGFQGKCDKSSPTSTKSPSMTVKVTPVDASLFMKENLLNEIAKEDCTLSDGTKTTCYKIVVKGKPQEHNMGPWCPERIDDGKEKGGIWFRDGAVFDVDGKFISNLDKFYSDPQWKLYREDGSVKITDTQAACEAAARPDVDPKYNNYCVQCSPVYYEKQSFTYLIPVDPVYLDTANSRFGRGAVLGVAFNGVRFDPPAPLQAILDAHTLAPLDDCGGHVNPHGGYHYHAATGCSKEAKPKSEQHSALLGYALDGFGIYARIDKDGKEPNDLDQCGGHNDETIGYHYHAGKSGGNQVISCFHGATGTSVLSE